jgi:hypothetical protein
VRGDGAIGAAVAGFGAETDAREGVGPGAAVPRGGVAITGVAAFVAVAARADAEAGVEAVGRAGALDVGVAIGAAGRARVDVCAAVVEAGGGAAAGVAAGGCAIGVDGFGAAAPGCAEPAIGATAGIAPGWATTDDFVVDGAGRSCFALLVGAGSRAGAGVGAGAELAAGFGVFVGGTGTVRDGSTRESVDVAALPAGRSVGVGSGMCGMGDRAGDSAGGVGLTGSATTACESRADGASMAAAGASRECRGAAGLSVAAAFGLAGVRFGRGATSVVAISLFFGAARRIAGLAGADASSGAAGSALATVALRLRSGFGRSASSIVRV